MAEVPFPGRRAVTIREALTTAPASLNRRDAELLLARVLERERTYLLAHPEALLSPAEHARFSELLARRANGEPMQYLIGTQEFYGLELLVTQAVLIPRPETELLVEAVELWATRFHDERTLEIVDVGTGSGAIAIALATHLAGCRMTAIDISEAALAVARENAERHECAERIQFLQGDLLAPVEGRQFDAIASNPPYIPAGDAATMQIEVVQHEPHSALFAGDDGLEIYRRLIPAAHAMLKPCGLLAMECGFGQRDALAQLLDGWKDVRFIDDYQGIPRIVLAERS